MNLIRSQLISDVKDLRKENLFETPFEIIANGSRKLIFHLTEFPLGIKYTTNRGNFIQRIKENTLIIERENLSYEIDILQDQVPSSSESSQTFESSESTDKVDTSQSTNSTDQSYDVNVSPILPQHVNKDSIIRSLPQSPPKSVHLVNIKSPSNLSSELSAISNLRVTISNNKLGVGYFSEVFEGLWGTTKVACKLLTIDVKLENFQEVALLNSLNHPNIVRFYGLHITLEGLKYIIMEYAEKGAVDSFLRKNKNQVSEFLLYTITRDLASAMDYLQSNQIIHCDLACRNLLITGNFETKLSDFGLSQICIGYIEKKLNNIPIKWSAPEILQHHIYSPHADVWSFGIVLWELWSFGKTPYADMDNTQTKAYVLNGQRLQSPPGCPPSIYHLMLQCWNVSPGNRPNYQTLLNNIIELRENYIKTHPNPQFLKTPIQSNTSQIVKDTSKIDYSKMIAFIPRTLLSRIEIRTNYLNFFQMLNEENASLILISFEETISKKKKCIYDMASPEIIEQFFHVVYQYSGDVIQIKESVLIFFEHLNEPYPSLIRALKCGVEIKKLLGDYKAKVNSSTIQAISFSVSLLFGSIQMMIFGNWNLIVHPTHLQELEAQSILIGDSIVCSHKLWEEILCLFVGGTQVNDLFVITTLNSDFPSISIGEDSIEFTNEMEQIIQSFVPLLRDFSEENWSLESRIGSLVTIYFPSLDLEKIISYKEVFFEIKAIIQRTKGYQLPLLSEANGITLLIVYFESDDGTYRAVQAGFELQCLFQTKFDNYKIAISSGFVRIKEFGCSSRKINLIEGQIVNLNQFLINSTSKYKFNICSQTYRNLISKIRVKPSDVEGLFESQKILFYVPSELIHEIITPQIVPIGRSAELSFILNTINSVLDGTRNSVVILIQGPPAVGKSTLLSLIKTTLEPKYQLIFTGMGNSLETSTRFYVFRSILAKMIELKGGLNKFIEDSETLEFKRFLPLLNSIIPSLKIPKNSMDIFSGDSKDNQLIDLFIELLDQFSDNPIVIFLEDLHWLDSGSWSLIFEIIQKITPIVLVMTSRSINHLSYQRLVSSCIITLPLASLSEEDTILLIQRHLKVTEQIPQQIVRLIYDTCGGNPYFSIEFLNALLEHSVITINSQSNTITIKEINLESLPKKIDSVIISRMEKLPPSQQELLCIASVLGSTFKTSFLTCVLDQSTIDKNLQEILQSNLICRLNKTTCRFKHELTRTCIYNSIQTNLRKKYHQAIAYYYENNSQGLSDHYQIMAYHFQQGECYKQAVFYYIQTIEQISFNHPSLEVIKIANIIFEMDATHHLLDVETKVKIRQLKARTYIIQGRLEDCKQELFLALEDLGFEKNNQNNYDEENDFTSIMEALNVTEISLSPAATQRLLHLGQILFLLSEAQYFLSEFDDMRYFLSQGITALHKIRSKVSPAMLIVIYEQCISYSVIRKHLDKVPLLRSIGENIIETSGINGEPCAAFYQSLAFLYCLASLKYDLARELTFKSKQCALLDRDHRRVVRFFASMGLIEQLCGNLKEASQFYKECYEMCDNINDILYLYEGRVNCALCYYWRGCEFDDKIQHIKIELKILLGKFPVIRRSQPVLNAFFFFCSVQSSTNNDILDQLKNKCNSLLKTKPLIPFAFIPFLWYLEALEWMILHQSPLLQNEEVTTFFHGLVTLYEPFSQIFVWAVPYLKFLQGKLLQISSSGVKEEEKILDLFVTGESLAQNCQNKFLQARFKMEIGLLKKDEQFLEDAKCLFEDCSSLRLLKKCSLK